MFPHMRVVELMKIELSHFSIKKKERNTAPDNNTKTIDNQIDMQKPFFFSA
jgi:hypothetical protein